VEIKRNTVYRIAWDKEINVNHILIIAVPVLKNLKLQQQATTQSPDGGGR
jgi:hypothetical protein